MRLLNALTLQLELFPDPVPDKTPYAILSHTWAHDEVCFDDMKDVSSAQDKAGFAKIRAACAMTRHHGLGYIWVDTCCIDKSSSAELSEAINSMFRWYKKSTVCFAFLSDLPQSSHETDLSALRNCRWWTRGWTLQELIAPTNLIFFDERWNSIGSKLDLCGTIESITGISRWVLDGSSPTSSVPLAKRMSWAAARDTTRIEDKAYCLLGIFDVNIPMMYGEGSRAFIRLQEEILRKTTDLSIFAWQASDHANKHRGILAESPAEFRNCSCIESSDDQFCFRDEISLTNRGVKIQTALQYEGDGTYMMDLHCYDESPHAPLRRGALGSIFNEP
ncbi:HET domain protein, partial [Metarhizium majus ARSEF 297]